VAPLSSGNHANRPKRTSIRPTDAEDETTVDGVQPHIIVQNGPLRQFGCTHVLLYFNDNNNNSYIVADVIKLKSCRRENRIAAAAATSRDSELEAAVASSILRPEFMRIFVCKSRRRYCVFRLGPIQLSSGPDKRVSSSMPTHNMTIIIIKIIITRNVYVYKYWRMIRIYCETRHYYLYV